MTSAQIVNYLRGNARIADASGDSTFECHNDDALKAAALIELLEQIVADDSRVMTTIVSERDQLRIAASSLLADYEIGLTAEFSTQLDSADRLRKLLRG